MSNIKYYDCVICPSSGRKITPRPKMSTELYKLYVKTSIDITTALYIGNNKYHTDNKDWNKLCLTDLLSSKDRAINNEWVCSVCSIDIEEQIENTIKTLTKFINHPETDDYLSYLNELKSLLYHEYLKTDHWEVVSAAAKERDNYRCRLCNSEKKPEVHHKCYNHRGEEQYYLEDLVTLCHDCHAKFHNIIE